MADDFVWCDVRDRDHACANNKPGHAEHVCCCGHVLPPEEHYAAAAGRFEQAEPTGRDVTEQVRERRRETPPGWNPTPPEGGYTAEDF